MMIMTHALRHDLQTLQRRRFARQPVPCPCPSLFHLCQPLRLQAHLAQMDLPESMDRLGRKVPLWRAEFHGQGWTRAKSMRKEPRRQV